MATRAAEQIYIERSSGNVFADLGLPDAVELATKVRVASEINRLVKRHRLTRVSAAARLRVSQREASALTNYKLDGFPVERLFSCLLALGQDVEIRITPRRHRGVPGRISVRVL